MRILLTTDTVGGVWTFTKELTAGLLETGHQVALVSFGRAPSPDQSAWCAEVRASHAGAFRYDGFAVPLEWMPQNAGAYSDAKPLLLRIAEEFSPELLHTNQFCFGRLPGTIPKLITAHSDVLSWAVACRPEGLEPSAWLTQYRSLVQQGLDAADRVAAPTQWMLDALKRNFPLTACSSVIHNGRSLPNAEERQYTLKAVTAGRLWDLAKNISLFKDVESPFPILVAGECEQGSQYALPDNVDTVGWQEDAALHNLFRASSMYIAPSIYEPFGLAPLEAALCGCAVLANDIPSLREVWGEAALYFSGAEELNRLLRMLADDPARLERARRRSHARASQLTGARMTESYIALYEQMLSHSTHEHAVYA